MRAEAWSTRARKLVAGGAVGTLLAGLLVVVGVGAQSANANDFRPTVEVGSGDTHLAGEDLTLTLTFSNTGGGAQFNLGAGVLLPADARFERADTLGAPTIHAAGALLPGSMVGAGAACADLGLASPTPAQAGRCAVPDGSQYLVFQNVSDLPAGARTTHELTLRPRAGSFPVGAEIPVRVNASTSSAPAMLPVFPGSTGVASALAIDATSGAGTADQRVAVNALRIEKTEPSPEGELLRGVHQNTTTYTLRVWHTGEGDVDDVVVTDLLPAGLEYLGLGGADRTTNANGNRPADASVEYDGAPRLDQTPPPADSTWDGAADPTRNLASAGAESVETVVEDGAVFTRVTWNVGQLLTSGLATYSLLDPTQQAYPDAAGAAGFFEIRYRAGIPLFENTMDFGYEAATDGQQGANLDNNRGASTRHIDSATTYVNRAEASGRYGAQRVVDTATAAVDAVDVRLLKTVDNGSFEQGAVARFTLNVATSEYASAEVSAAPNRLTDRMDDGLCAVFPAGTPITPGATGSGAPRLLIAGSSDPLSPAEWNDRVPAQCAFPSGTADADDALVGGTLSGITFDPATGRFDLEFALPETLAAGDSAGRDVRYSVTQQSVYVTGAGATTSGDTFANDVEIHATTTATDAVSGVQNSGGVSAGDIEIATDDSAASLTASFTSMQKQVLPREAGVPDADSVNDAQYRDSWVDSAPTPFAIGDEIWYRITVSPPSGTDVRNPQLTDFLPQGVTFDPADPRDLRIIPSSSDGIGSCAPGDEQAWLDTFVPGATVEGQAITFELGNNCGLGGSDRFLPLDAKLDIYLKVTVVDQAAFGEVDLPQNLAKYQQNNVDGEIFFLRDSAEVTLAQGLQLLKGIRDINDIPGDGEPFGSDIDGLQVVQGDDVTFRLDVTTPQVDTTDYVIWDALPNGITRGDVLGADPATGAIGAADATAALVTPSASVPLSSGWTAHVYDHGSYPTEVASSVRDEVVDAERSIIVWTVSAKAPGSVGDERNGFTLGYTVTIPVGAQVTQRYENDAAIVQFATVSNGGQPAIVVPTGDGTLSTRGAADGEFAIPAAGTFDDSDVFLPDVAVVKSLVSTEIGATSPDDNGAVGEHPKDPGNAQGAIVQGELATYEYSVTVPARTTVVDGRLADDGQLRWSGNRSVHYHAVSGSAQFSALDAAGAPIDAFDWAGFDRVGDAADGERAGTLVFPSEYTNDTDGDQTFVVRITAWVEDRDASNPSRTPDLADRSALTNTARFVFADPNGSGTSTRSDTADVTYHEPRLRIAKSATVASDESITYRLSISNNGRVQSYDNTVVDTVPAGVIVSPTQAGLAGAVLSDADALADGEGGTITWSHEQIEQLQTIPATATLSYTATLRPDAGAGRDYVNTADVTGYTLPASLDGAAGRRGDRVHAASATVTAVSAGIEKGVRLEGSQGSFDEAVAAPIGDTVEYEIKVTLPKNVNFYNARITDAFGGSGIGAPERVRITGPTADAADSVPGTWSFDDEAGAWTIDNAGSPHIATASHDRTLTITYAVQLADDLTADGLDNTATFAWTTTPDGSLDDPRDRRQVTDGARVDIPNPVLLLDKQVDGRSSITRNPDASFDYTLTVTNTGATPAHNVEITDVVPQGVIIDGPIPNGGVLQGAAETGGGTIAWSIPGPISNTAGENTLTLTYSGRFAGSGALTATAYVNEAEITRYESFDEDGRAYVPGTDNAPPAEDDASVTPLFPSVVPVKSVTNPVASEDYGIAYAGERFGWTLTVTNQGRGIAEDVSVIDELPTNWEYVEGSAVITTGQTSVAIADPSVTAGAAGDELTWSAPQIRAAGAAPLAAAASFTIAFDAQPTEAALTDAGTGVEVHAHTNTLRVTATDAQGNDRNGEDDYVGDASTADAYIAEADLLLVKRAVGGVTDEGDPASNLHGLEAGSWVPGQAAGAGYDQPQWQITVTNQGPDASVGPFEIVDTLTQPAGVTTGAWSASYYPAGGGTPISLPVTGTGTTDSPFVLGSEMSLRPDGSDRIVLTADVSITADATATAGALGNVASVDGRTFEPDAKRPDNTDEVDKPLTPVADLALTKAIADPAPLAVADAITWSITARNLGPSASMSSADAPITISDTVPAGVAGVQATSNADWTASASNGFPAAPGDVVTWTYRGDSIAPGALAASVSLTGTILSSQTEAVTNAAIVHPGKTPDPTYVADPTAPGFSSQNNRDEVSITPTTPARLTISKTRVVDDGAGAWRDADPTSADDAFVAGDPVHHRLTVTNTGPADARNVTVVDETPAGLAYSAHEDDELWAHASGGTTSEFPMGAPGGRSFATFELDGTLASGAEQSIVVRFATLPTIVDDIDNWAEVTAENWDPNDPRPYDRDDDSTGSTRVVDLGIVKEHTGDGPFTPGTPVEFTLTVTNHGPSATNGPILVEDTLPVGLAYVAGSARMTTPGGTPIATEPVPAADGRVLSWTARTSSDEFGPGAQIVVTFDAVIADTLDAGVSLTNRASADGPDPEPSDDPHPNEDEDVVVTGEPSATMEIVKQVQDAAGAWVELTQLSAGTQAKWRMSIVNHGPSAVPVTFTDALPAGLSVASVSGAGWECSDASASCTYVGNEGLHPVGDANATTIELTSDIASSVPPTAAPGLVNTGRISWTDGTTVDPTDRDDAAITITRVADLGLVKSAVDADGETTTTAVAGSPLWYRLTLTNHGASDAVAPLVVEDTLPQGIAFVALTPASAGSWTAEVDAARPQHVTFTRAHDAGLAADDAAPAIEFEVSVDAEIADGTALRNVAEISAGTLQPNDDPNPSNDADEAEVRVEPVVAVSIDKAHTAAAPDEYRIGDAVEYTLGVANEGPSVASGITVTDRLPSGLVFESLEGTGWSLVSQGPDADGRVVVVAEHAGTLAPGAAAPQLRIRAVVTVGIGDAETLVNDACVAVAETNTNAEPCDTDAIVTVPLADLAIEKTVTTEPAAITAGSAIDWQVTVRNLGPSDSRSTPVAPITVIDVVPAGISGVTDPSTDDWEATVTRAGEPSSFPAVAGDVITWIFQGERLVANTDPAAAPAVSLTLTGTIDAGWIGGEIANTAVVHPGQTRDPEEPNNTSTAPVTPGDHTQLRIDKVRVVEVDGRWVTAIEQEPMPAFHPGEDVSYRLTVINDGPADARAVTVVDEAPTGLAYETHEDESGGWTHRSGGATSGGDDPAWDTFVLGGIQPVDASRSLIVTYGTDPSLVDATDLTNWTEVTAENWPDGFDRDEDDITSTRSADLSIAKSHTAPAADAAVVAGETVEYRLVIMNHGPSISDAPITVADTLPTGFSYEPGTARVTVGAQAPAEIDPAVSGAELVWSDVSAGAPLEPLGSVEITFTARVADTHEPTTGVENAALVDGPNDSNLANDRDTDPVDVVTAADLVIDKTSVTAMEEVTAGESISWLLSPRNLGPSVSTSSAEHAITVSDRLPAGILGLTADPSNADWSATTSNEGGWRSATAGDTVTWTYRGAELAVGAGPDIAVAALIDPAWTGGAITNVAVLEPGETPDPHGPNEGTSTVTPRDRTALSIWKHRVVEIDGDWVTASSLDPIPAFAPGTDVTYRIDVVNDGPAVARDVLVLDAIPAGLSDPRITSLPGMGAWTATTAACEVGVAELAGYAASDCVTATLAGALGVGGSEGRAFLVTFASDAAIDPEVPVVNWAQAGAANVPEPERPTDVDSTDGVPAADLSLSKTAATERVLAGEPIDYRLEVVNEGPSASRGAITVSDRLPIGMSYVPGSGRVAVGAGTPAAAEPVIDEATGAERLQWTPLSAAETLAPGETITITLQAAPQPGVYAPDGLRNVAAVSGPDDSAPWNNEDDAVVRVDPLVTLVVEKAAVGDFIVGAHGTFTMTVRNVGPTDDPGPITITDALPEGLEFVSSPDEGVRVEGRTVSWTVPDGLAAGESITRTVVVAIEQGAHPSVTNRVVIETPTQLTPESVMEADVTVAVAAGDSLPTTGGSMVALWVILVALLLVIAGGVLVVSGRRREA